MDILIIVLAILTGLVGIAGSILPGLPGPPISWIGILLLFIWGPEDMSVWVLIIWGIVTVVVTVLDYIVPVYFTKVTGGSRYAERGATSGLILGMVFTPVGMILGSILGALLTEWYYRRKGFWQAFKAAIGAFLGFVTGTGVKVLASGCMMWAIVLYCI